MRSTIVGFWWIAGALLPGSAQTQANPPERFAEVVLAVDGMV